MTEFDFSEALATASQEPRPILRFFTQADEVPGKSAEEGRPVYVDRDYVEIIWPGARDIICPRAEDRAKKDPYVKQAYEHWKKTREQPVEGTPLTEVPFLKPSQIKEMQAQNVMSLEQLAGLTDTQAPRIAFDGMQLRDKAIAYMKAAKDTALAMKLKAELDQRDRDIAVLRDELVKLNARFEAEKARA